jgi:hypothetical protein
MVGDISEQPGIITSAPSSISLRAVEIKALTVSPDWVSPSSSPAFQLSIGR